MLARACVASILLAFGIATAATAATADEYVSTYATGVSGAKDFVFDAAGNMYVTGQGGGAGILYKIGPGGSPVTQLATGMTDPWGIVFDATGNLLVADFGTAGVANSGRIWSITTAGVKSTYKSGLQSPMFLAFGPGGDLYFTDWASLKVQKLTSGGVVSDYGSGLSTAGNEIGGLAFDDAGNLYIGAGDNLKAVGPGGSPVTTLASGLGSIVGLDRLSDGTFYLARYSFRDIWTVSPAGAASKYVSGGGACAESANPVPRLSVTGNYTGSAHMHGGRLFYTDSGCNRVRVLDFVTPAANDSWGRVKSIYRR